GAFLCLLGLVVAVVLPATAQPATAAVASTVSAKTVQGTGPFSTLSVTVSQTRDLVDQTVEVSWSGVPMTTPTNGDFFSRNYLQLMQCWGDDPAGPTREQCQFGGTSLSDLSGQNTATRQITTAGLVDPLETEYAGTDGALGYVPFHAVNGTTVTGRDINQYFDSHTTNEIPYARTRADGTGLETFETQTGLESPGLGCGQVPAGATAPHRCWLVVVPRADREVDGSIRSDSSTNELQTSPLSASNWSHHIAIELSFVPVGQACPIGRDEQPILGNELVAEAVSRWQAGVCAGGGTNFSYSGTPDRLARAGLAGDSPSLRMLSAERPFDAPGVTPLYAPVALSGITIAFFVERQSDPSRPDSVRVKNGRLITDIKLSARLVAKLLTQSYRADTFGQDAIAANPFDLSRDPEFLALNPEFRELTIPKLAGIMLPPGLSDAAYLVWRYVVADADARAFLAGTPDKWGMKVNPRYKNQQFPQEQFPRADTSCVPPIPATPPPPPRCTIDLVPYADNMGAGARAAVRGDAPARVSWDPLAVPPSYKKGPRQPAGRRSMIALVDTASAERYGLVTAQLENASGHFVAPSTASMAAAASVMKPGSVTGTLVADPTSRRPDAYPLTAYTYAATVPGRLSKSDATNYAQFLDYAVTTGQRPGVAVGDLPFGYVPLPATEVARTRGVASHLVAQAGTGSSGGTAPVAGPGIGGTGTPAQSPTDGAAVPVAVPVAAAATPAASSGSSGSSGHPVATPPPAFQALPVSRFVTPAQPVGPGRFGAVAALLLGGLALLVRGALPWIGRGRRQ
ncbi:MAG: hypothetical protein QOF57_120, partial [Frankiaceae bacterium]|nr:hypothetical protein [Frankiaceae bacterium]